MTKMVMTKEMKNRQAAIEREVGINKEIGDHITKQKTLAAKMAMNILIQQITHRESTGMALLKAAVEDCRKEMAAKK